MSTAFGQRASVAPIGTANSVATETRDPAAIGVFNATLKNHQICMVVPAGSVMDALTFELPGGVLILGALRGRVRCATGSAIIAAGGEFQGSLEANDVLVEGKITSLLDPKGKPFADGLSEITARGQVDSKGKLTGGIVALSATAFVCARLHAHAYSIPRSADLSCSVLETLAPLRN